LIENQSDSTPRTDPVDALAQGVGGLDVSEGAEYGAQHIPAEEDPHGRHYDYQSSVPEGAGEESYTTSSRPRPHKHRDSHRPTHHAEEESHPYELDPEYGSDEELAGAPAPTHDKKGKGKATGKRDPRLHEGAECTWPLDVRTSLDGLR
jgi:hypothetical protein